MFNQKFSSLMTSLKNKSQKQGLPASRLYILAGIAVLLIVAAVILMSADDKPKDSQAETFELNANQDPALSLPQTPNDAIAPDVPHEFNQPAPTNDSFGAAIESTNPTAPSGNNYAQPTPNSEQNSASPFPQNNPDNQAATIEPHPSDNSTAAVEPPPVAAPKDESYTLFCGGWSNKNTAEGSKAKIAYSVGVYSAVIQRNGLYLLKFGPFKDRDQALKIFKKLDSNGLLSQECSLEQGH